MMVSTFAVPGAEQPTLVMGAEPSAYKLENSERILKREDLKRDNKN